MSNGCESSLCLTEIFVSFFFAFFFFYSFDRSAAPSLSSLSRFFFELFCFLSLSRLIFLFFRIRQSSRTKRPEHIEHSQPWRDVSIFSLYFSKSFRLSE